jgi:hypothetical protein
MVHRRSHQSSLSFRIRVCHPNTRIYVRLLGPCFKTGRLEPFRQHPKRWCDWSNRAPYGRPQSRPQEPCLKPDFQEAIGNPNNAAILSPAKSMTRGYNARAEARTTFLWLFTLCQTDVDLSTGKCTQRTLCRTLD